ncbi:MAG: hypothetical protein QM718_02320 [Steroidobacteraceae bacterium]
MNRLTGISLAAAVLAGCLSCSSKAPQTAAAIANPHDLSGVWQIAQPMQALQTVDGKAPPLTADAQKTYDARRAATRAGDNSWDDAAKCKPPGEPRTLFENGWPFQIGQNDKRVTFMFQWNSAVRVVEMGLKLPDFAGPFFFGKSSGRWDGDTLVVDVIGIREEVALDSTGLPHTEDLKLTERFRLIDADTLEARLHFDDAATFTQAWDAVLTFKRQPETAIVEDHCLDRLNLPNSYRPTL